MTTNAAEQLGILLSHVADELFSITGVLKGKKKNKKSKMNAAPEETKNGPDFSVSEETIPLRVVSFLTGAAGITPSNQHFNHFVP